MTFSFILPAELRAVYEIACRLLPSEERVVDLIGLTCAPARSASADLRMSDLTRLLVPGLAAVGVRAELIDASADRATFDRAIHERTRRGVDVPMLTVTDSQTDDSANDDENEEPFADPAISGIAILNVPPDEIADGSLALIMKRQTAPRGYPRENANAALLRWAAYGAAFPSRTISNADVDARNRSAATMYLTRLAGAGRTPRNVRLRRASESFAANEPDDALSYLTEAALLPLGLPSVVYAALISHESCALDGIERRELIYMARAGTLELRALAARRLQPERASSDVARTLDQLARSQDPWVRSAASDETSN